MIDFIPLLQPPQDGNGILHSRFIDLYGLETSLEGFVLLDVLAVFVECGRADAVELASGQHGLQHVSGIHRPVGLARADDQMQLVNKQDNPAFRLPHFLQHGFQTLFKFPPVLRAGYQRSHVQRENVLVLEIVRHIAFYDTLGESFHSRRLADAGLTDEHRVILGFSRQDQYGLPDLIIPSDHRIQLLLLSFLYQVLAVLAQCVVSNFRIIRHDFLVAPDLRKRLQKSILGDSILLKKFLHAAVRVFQDGQEQVLDGRVFITHRPGFIRSLQEYLVEVRSDIRPGSAHLDAGIQRLLHRSVK